MLCLRNKFKKNDLFENKKRNNESGAKPERLKHVRFIREVPESNPSLNTFTDPVTFGGFTYRAWFFGYCVWPEFAL